MVLFGAGYPGQYMLDMSGAHDGAETKRSFPYVAGEYPGDIIIPASKGRPLYALEFNHRLKIANNSEDTDAVGSGLAVVNRIWEKILCSDGYDVLTSLALDSENAINKAFWLAHDEATLDTIPFGEVFETKGIFVLPIYSEIPVILSLKLWNILSEWVGGDLEQVAGYNTLWVSAIYGDERLKYEQPILEQHTEELGVGRESLESIRAIKPFYGIIECRSTAGEEPVHIRDLYEDFDLQEMKDDKNEQLYNHETEPSSIYYDGDTNSLQLFTDRSGHMNQEHSEVALTPVDATTLTYVALHSPLPGNTAKKVGKLVVAG
jgi:hypothetical protein